MSDKLLEYRSIIYRNSEAFLFNFKEQFAAFGETVNYINVFSTVISTERMIAGKTLIGFLPHFSLIHRQYLNAFQCFSIFQSYEGWVLLRPAIESLLIMGKWLDDRNNFEIWKNHEEDWKSYNSVYSGKNLASKSLPESENIQSVLKKLNDKFMHANPSYYKRHSELQPIDKNNYVLWTSFFDDQKEHEVHLHAFLHLTLFMLHKLGLMLQPLYEKKAPFNVNLAKLQNLFEKRVKALAQEDRVYNGILIDLGLWPVSIINPT